MSTASNDRPPSAPPESALILRVPAAEPYVADLRERFDPVAPLGVPAHVTILVPFVPPALIDEDVVRRLRAALAGARPFTFRLADVRCFPDVVYLAPEPPDPFVALTSAVHTAFPQHPPYRGVHASVVPHLTVAHLRGDEQRAIEEELRRALPSSGAIEARCDELVVIENTTGRWHSMHVLALA